MIEVEALSKIYSDGSETPFRAVDAVSFSVRAGEIFGLLGPNGAGKTTTLRILSTVLRPSEGSARIAGFDTVTQPEEVRRRIGFMSANTSVYDRMTGGERCSIVRYSRQYCRVRRSLSSICHLVSGLPPCWCNSSKAG